MLTEKPSLSYCPKYYCVGLSDGSLDNIIIFKYYTQKQGLPGQIVSGHDLGGVCYLIK